MLKISLPCILLLLTYTVCHGENLTAATENLNSLAEQQIASTLQDGDFKRAAVFKVIDKKLGKMDVLKVPITTPMLYHNEIIIKPLGCWSESENKLFKDHKAFLELYKVLEDGGLEKYISEWVFSKNPSLSTQRGDRYEILLEQCVD